MISMNMILKKLAPPPFIPVKAMVGAPIRLIIACAFLPWYCIVGGINWLWMIIFYPMNEEVFDSHPWPYYKRAFRNIRCSWRWAILGVDAYEYDRLEWNWKRMQEIAMAIKNAKEDVQVEK